METILEKLSLQIFLETQQLWPEASFLEWHLGWSVLRVGVQGGWSWNWGLVVVF